MSERNYQPFIEESKLNDGS
ncbi:unnamed protein product, partial [Allacma fusca]